MTEKTTQLLADIFDKLTTVIDPETGIDVVNMRLVGSFEADEKGNVRYVFRPSSPLCPLAVPLVQQIKRAVSEVPGVASQYIEVRDYMNAEGLTEMINREDD